MLLLLFSKNGSTTTPSDGSSIFGSGRLATGKQHITFIDSTMNSSVSIITMPVFFIRLRLPTHANAPTLKTPTHSHTYATYKNMHTYTHTCASRRRLWTCRAQTTKKLSRNRADLAGIILRTCMRDVSVATQCRMYPRAALHTNAANVQREQQRQLQRHWQWNWQW